MTTKDEFLNAEFSIPDNCGKCNAFVGSDKIHIVEIEFEDGTDSEMLFLCEDCDLQMMIECSVEFLDNEKETTEC